MTTTIATVANTRVEILSVNGGWSKVKFPCGSVRKVRNSQIQKSEVSTMNAVADIDQSQATPAPAPKAKREPKIGVGVLAGRTTKIKDVEVDLGRYEVAPEVTQSGRHVIDNGDEVATALRTATLDDVYRIAAKALLDNADDHTIDVMDKALRAQYSGLNPGMQRMNLGNRIRGAEAAKAKARERAAKKAAAERTRNDREAAKVKAAAEKEAAKLERQAEREAKAAEKAAAKAAAKAE